MSDLVTKNPPESLKIHIMLPKKKYIEKISITIFPILSIKINEYLKLKALVFFPSCFVII